MKKEMNRQPNVYKTIVFEFEIFEPHKHQVVTKSGLSAKALKALDLVLGLGGLKATMVSEITGCYASEAITVLIITLSAGYKIFYYKNCWYNDTADWFASSKRQKLEDQDYTLCKDAWDISMAADLYPAWWPEDMMDPLAIAV